MLHSIPEFRNQRSGDFSKPALGAGWHLSYCEVQRPKKEYCLCKTILAKSYLTVSHSIFVLDNTDRFIAHL